VHAHFGPVDMLAMSIPCYQETWSLGRALTVTVYFFSQEISRPVTWCLNS